MFIKTAHGFNFNMIIQRFVFVDPNYPEESILDMAALLLRDGKIIVYPTDTTYALGANALDTSALNKLFRLKRRSTDKPIHVVVANLEVSERFVVLNEDAKILAKKFLPGPLTLILPKKETIPDMLVGGRKTLGIRIPDNKTCLMLAQKAQIPITTTSANISGQGNPYTIDEVVKQFGSQIDQVDVIIDQGGLSQTTASTIIDLTVSPPVILREGPISGSKLLEAIGYQT